jgi:hypothetical protein
MALTLDTAVARFPELGGSAQDIFALVQVGAVASSRQTLVGHGAGVARRPLCLALCLDASSSMRGPRFALALQAARDVVHSLGPDDRFAVVTFDRNARTVLGATTLDADGQHTASRTLDRLTTGVGTNLSAGWREAAEGLLRAMVPGAVRRVLVLTDGYPSRGETQPEACARWWPRGPRGASRPACWASATASTRRSARASPAPGRGGFITSATRRASASSSPPRWRARAASWPAT